MEFIISADFLQLYVGIHQRLPIPQPYVVDGCLVGLDCLEREVLFGRERLRRDLMEIVGLLGQRDVALDVRPLQFQLVRFYEYGLEESWNHARQQEGATEDEHYRCYWNSVGTCPDVHPRGECCNDRKPNQQPENGQPHIDVGVARADHHPVVAIEQQIAVETVGPRLYCK